MLAQNFKSATDLEITEQQRLALIKTLVLLETGKLTHKKKPDDNEMLHFGFDFKDGHPVLTGHFNMDLWTVTYRNCGTIACIGGTAEIIGGPGVGFVEDQLPENLQRLFYPFTSKFRFRDITTAQAATALRSYLTTGNPHWEEIT